MSWYVIGALILLLVAILLVLLQRRKAADQVKVDQANLLDEQLNREMLEAIAQMKLQTQAEDLSVSEGSSKSTSRLTNNQMLALSTASDSYPIYAEGRNHINLEYHRHYSPRTIDSLVKRGFLEGDDTNGYSITSAGHDGLRRGYGF